MFDDTDFSFLWAVHHRISMVVAVVAFMLLVSLCRKAPLYEVFESSLTEGGERAGGLEMR